MAHKHAALMALYAQDAAESDTPWERWEFRREITGWTPLKTDPAWITHGEYRRKPKTIVVNGFEIQAPLDKKPRDGEPLWIPSVLSKDFAFDVCFRESIGHGFKRKILHSTKEAAVAHAKAMLGIDPGEG